MLRPFLAVSALALVCSAASCGSTPSAAPPSGSTGAFGIVTVDGVQKLYLPLETTNPAGHAVVAVVDVGIKGNGVAGAPALLRDIDLGGAEIATATSGIPSLVIAASTQNPTVYFIDPKTDTVKKKITLDPTWGESSFSGGGGFVTGIAMDPDHHRAILSIYKGFAIVDTDSLSVQRTIEAAPSENFGFDVTNQRILAPFYDCSSSHDKAGTALTFCDRYKNGAGQTISDGLNVIDLTDDTVYTFQNPAATNPTATLGSEPDSAAADPTTGLVVVPSEGNGRQNVLDFTKASFDKAAKTVTAPVVEIPNVGHEGAAIESSTHLAFLEHEHTSGVAVLDLSTATKGTPEVATGTMPHRPDGNSWSNMGDPHGIAVTTGLSDSHAVGFVVSSDRKWVARVDLQAFLAMRKNPTIDMAPAVTMLDGRTPK